MSSTLYFRNDRAYLASQLVATCYNALDFSIEFGDINNLACIFLLDISVHAEVVTLLGNFAVRYEFRKMLNCISVCVCGNDSANVFLRQFIVICHFNKLTACVNEQRRILIL